LSNHLNNRSAIFTSAVIILSVVAVSAIILVAIFKPSDTSTGTLIIGMLLPVITAFLAAALKDLHGAVNSRLTELIEITRRDAHAEGKLDQRRESEDERK